jgi:hypothetical protein
MTHNRTLPDDVVHTSKHVGAVGYELTLRTMLIVYTELKRHGIKVKKKIKIKLIWLMY